jgi:hypothetical protein
MTFQNAVWVACLAVFAGTVYSEEAPSGAGDKAAAKQHHQKLDNRLAEDSDGTVNSSNIKISNTYAAKRYGSWNNTTKVQLSYAFGHSKNGSWSFRLGLPYEAFNPEDSKKDDQYNGLGDISMRINRTFKVTKKLRLGLAVENTFDTAKEDELGGQADVLEVKGNSTYHINKIFRAQLSLSYSGSIHTEEDVGYSSKSTITPALAFKLPFHSLCTTSYIGNFNYKTSKFDNDAKIQLSHLFGKKKKWSGNFYYKVPLQMGKTRYSLNAGLTYHL